MRLAFSFAILAALCFADTPATTVRGKLVQSAGSLPSLRTADGKTIALEGDKETESVLKDKRLAGAEMEIRGETTASDKLRVAPFHTKAMFVIKEGKRLAITYWCDLCAIRTYTPGICWCCQEETALDLRDPAEHDH